MLYLKIQHFKNWTHHATSKLEMLRAQVIKMKTNNLANNRCYAYLIVYYLLRTSYRCSGLSKRS